MPEEMQDEVPTGYSICFTQYIPPNGRKTPIDFDMATKESWEKAQLIEAAGFRFEIEILMDGKASATIGDDNADWAYAIHANGPGLETAINQMILDFDIEACAAKSKAMTASQTQDQTQG